MSKSKTGKREIEKFWDDNSKIGTVEGCTEMAYKGDRRAIKTLMGSFVMKVENGRPPAPEIMDWIAQAFVQILGNEKIDVVSVFRPGIRGRRPLDSKDRQCRFEIAQFIIRNSSPEDRGSLRIAIEGDKETEGFEGAMQKFGIEKETAYLIYYGYKIDQKL